MPADIATNRDTSHIASSAHLYKAENEGLSKQLSKRLRFAPAIVDAARGAVRMIPIRCGPLRSHQVYPEASCTGVAFMQKL